MNKQIKEILKKHLSKDAYKKVKAELNKVEASYTKSDVKKCFASICDKFLDSEYLSDAIGEWIEDEIDLENQEEVYDFAEEVMAKFRGKLGN